MCAAVIRQNGSCLICSRPEGSKWQGFREFPGGKIEPGETVSQCICRELKEELNLKIRALDTIWVMEHEYPEYRVRVHFVRCMICPDSPEPESRENQAFCWVRTGDLPEMNLLPADMPLALWLMKN